MLPILGNITNGYRRTLCENNRRTDEREAVDRLYDEQRVNDTQILYAFITALLSLDGLCPADMIHGFLLSPYFQSVLRYHA